MTKLMLCSWKSVTIFSILMLTTLGSPLVAQAEPSSASNASSTDQSQEVDPELEELKEQLEELKVRADILETQRSILTNSLPRVTATPLDGTITNNARTGEPTFETQILAYQALSETAEALKSELSAVPGLASLVVLDKEAFQNAATYQAYSYLYESLITSYKRELGLESGIIPNLTALEIPTTILRSVADFFALFRTNTTINNFSVTLPEEALVAQLSRQFQSDTTRSVRVLYPAQYSLNIDVVMDELNQLIELKNKAEERIVASSPNDPIITKLNDLNKKAEEAIVVISKPDTLSTLAKGAGTAKALAAADSYVLLLKTEGGGSNRTTRNLFFGSRLRHSGGAIVNYILFNTQGEIVTSNTLYYHTGYVRIRTNEPITNIQQ
jgi:hypothetical protein